MEAEEHGKETEVPREEPKEVSSHHEPSSSHHHHQKRRLSKGGRTALRIILVASLATASYSGWQLYMGLKEYRESESAYEALADSNKTEVQEIAPVSEEGPAISYEKVDFAALAEINPDVAGWLSLEGTVINYPIVQGTDNDYYLEHLFTREVNHTGCIFIDFGNAKDFSDRNTILYAHHMRNGSMFAELEGYREQSYYESHRELVLQTPSGLYLIQPFAGILTDGYADYVQLHFEDDAEFLAYVDRMRSSSTFSSDVDVTASDRIVTMSTCRYDVENGRYAVFGKLIPLN
jgi:sortase B